MSTRTRYFVIVSLLVLAIGLGTGLVAYYVGVPGPFARTAGPAELKFVPKDATVVAYANVREVMASDVRQKVRQYAPNDETGQRDFRNETGIDIESDIDRVVACLDGSKPNTGGMVLASGRFNETKIEGLMRDHGATVEDYHGKRLVTVDAATLGKQHAEEQGSDTPEASHKTGRFALAFIQPGLVAVGSADLVRQAIDGSGGNVTANSEVMGLVKSLDSGNAWAVGRFDALRANAHLPEQVAAQIPAITWFSVTTRIDGGIRGTLRAETRDEEAANNLRDVVRGFMALAKMQAGTRPEMQAMLQALQLGGSGKTVALSFDIPAQAFDALGAAAGQHRRPTKPGE